MGSKSSAPEAPDYTNLAELQGAQSSANIQQQSAENHPNTTTPFGESGWTFNPATQQWSGSSSLNPTLQSTLQSQEGNALTSAGTQGKVAGAAGNLFNQEMGSGNFNPVDYSGVQKVQGGNYYNPQAQKAVWDQFNTMQKPLQDQQTQSEQAQLYGQGLRPGDQAYDTAMKNLSNTQYQQTQNAEDQAVLAGDQEAQTMQGMDVQAQQAQMGQIAGQQNQNLNLFNTIFGMGNSQPNYGSTSISGPTTGAAATPDLVNAMGQTYGAQLNATNAQNAGNASLWSGIGSLAGDAAMIAAFSDRRLKKNLRAIGETYGGIPVYAYHYLWNADDEPLWIGVLAQDAPVDAVFMHKSGFAMVDYSRVQ